MLTLVDVTKRYGPRTALDRVSFDVGAGELLGLLGPNGAGKTTLVSIVAGLCRLDGGRVFVGGVDAVAHPEEVRRRVGIAPQDTSLYEVLTVRENLMFFAELVGLRRRQRLERLDELAHAFRLVPLLERAASELSGGERRRLHTAIAFVHRPSLLLLDEATVGADIETRGALLDVVRSAVAEGATVLYSTHYLPEIEALGASVGILHAGRLIARGSLDALVAAHGYSAVELTFDGPPPSVDLGEWRATVDGVVMRVEVTEPARALPAIMHRLDACAARVRSVEVLRPSLDSVFLALTGRRYVTDRDVAAA